MGLDQMLYRRTYVGSIHKITVENPDEKYNLPKIDADKIVGVVEEVMCWRKANQIHKWFVDNIQNGVDDCGTYAVSLEKLQELVDLCKQVLENPEKASELLPTQSGFFFGGIEYDEYYFEDLEKTIKGLEEIMPTIDGFNNSLEYSSSW